MPAIVEWGRILDCRKSADQQSTVTTLANVNDMLFPVVAGIGYSFDFLVAFQTAALTTGIGLAVTCPASPSYISYEAQIPVANDAPAGTFHGHGTSSGDTILSTAVPAINTVYVARLFGILRTGVSGGNLQLQFRTEIAASAVTIKQGSMGLLTWG